MLKKRRGFTLVELLVVVAIIGILASLLVINALSAIHKSKQKASMKDMMSISTAVVDYVSDNGAAPTQSGTYSNETPFYSALCPFYIKVLPHIDYWGSGYRAWCGLSANQYGVLNPGMDDFLIASLGRDKIQEGFSFNPDLPGAGLFLVDAMSDFDKDLVMWNGSWIRVPRIATSPGS